MKRFELSTLSLARRCSTTELHPQTTGRSQRSGRQRRQQSHHAPSRVPLGSAEPHQSLAGGLLEAQPFVEAVAVGGHQIDTLGRRDRWCGQQRGHQAAAQALSLLLPGHHHIPEDGPVGTIAGAAAEAHQLAVLPSGHHRFAAPQHPAKPSQGASLGPEAVGFEQLFQLFHGPHRPQPGAEAKTQARGAASVAQELDGAAQGGEGLPWQAYGPAWCRAGWLASCRYACAAISRALQPPDGDFFVKITVR